MPPQRCSAYKPTEVSCVCCFVLHVSLSHELTRHHPPVSWRSPPFLAARLIDLRNKISTSITPSTLIFLVFIINHQNADRFHLCCLSPWSGRQGPGTSSRHPEWAGSADFLGAVARRIAKNPTMMHVHRADATVSPRSTRSSCLISSLLSFTCRLAPRRPSGPSASLSWLWYV
jgi:hypothetical protein